MRASAARLAEPPPTLIFSEHRENTAALSQPPACGSQLHSVTSLCPPQPRRRGSHYAAGAINFGLFPPRTDSPRPVTGGGESGGGHRPNRPFCPRPRRFPNHQPTLDQAGLHRRLLAPPLLTVAPGHLPRGQAAQRRAGSSAPLTSGPPAGAGRVWRSPPRAVAGTHTHPHTAPHAHPGPPPPAPRGWAPAAPARRPLKLPGEAGARLEAGGGWRRPAPLLRRPLAPSRPSRAPGSVFPPVPALPGAGGGGGGTRQPSRPGRGAQRTGSGGASPPSPHC